MKKFNLFNRLFILLVAVCAMSTNVWAHRTMKITAYANPSANGFVYVSDNSTPPSEFTETKSSIKLESLKGDGVIFYLFASPQPGYKFVKWEGTEGFSFTSTDQYTSFSTSVGSDDFSYNVNANFTEASFTVTLDPNQGTGGTSSVTATYLADMPTISSFPTRSGYTFDGYADASGKLYYDYTGKSANFWDKTSNSTLYAKWLTNSNLYIDYAGGKCGDYTVLSVPATTTGQALVKGRGNYSTLKGWSVPTRDGYTLTGIFDADNVKVYNADGTCVTSKYWDASTTYIFDGDLTATARWSANDYTITLDKNGGATNGSAKITFDTKTLQNFVPAIMDYVSVSGYYTATSGGMLVIDKDGKLQKNVSGYTDADGNWKKADNITLYAQWTNSHFEPQAFIAGVNNPAKVDDTFTLNVQNVSDGLTGDFKVTYNADEFTVTRAGNVITIKTIKAGVNSVTFEQKAVSSTLFAEKVTYTFDVTKYDNTISWTYANSMYMASTQTGSVSATNPAAISVEQTAGATIAGLNDAHNTVTSYGTPGSATWKFYQEETYKYKAAETTMSIMVCALPAASCNVLELDPTKKTFNETKENPYQLSGPGKTITFLMWKYTMAVLSGDPHIKGSADGGGYGRVSDVLSISTDETPKTVILNDRTYRKLYVISDNQNNFKYVKNFQVTRDTYLETPASITIEKTAKDSFIFVGQPGTATLKVDWSVCNGGDIYLQSTNPKFTLSENHIAVTDGSDGTKNITVTYQSDVEGTDTGEIIAYNQVYRSVTMVTGITGKMYFATSYAEARPKVKGVGLVYVSENMTKPDAPHSWVTSDKRDISTNEYPFGVSTTGSADISSDFYAKAETGYTFDGWFTDEACTVSAGMHDPANMNKLTIVLHTTETTKPGVEKTLYAKFIPATPTVTFDPQGGTVTPTTSTVTCGFAYSAGTGGWPTPTRTGHTFVGWFTAADNTGVKVEGADIVALTVNQTLYAHWTKKVSPTINYNGASDYKVDATAIDLSALWTSTSDGAITYSIESFVPAAGEQTGATAPAITGNKTLSLGQAGTLTIKLTQFETEDYCNAEETQVITISRIANTLTVSPATKEMKVGDEWTDVASNINSDGAITGETNDATLATYDVTNNKIVATNTDSKALPSDVTITVKQAQTYKYKAAEATIKISVVQGSTTSVHSVAISAQSARKVLVNGQLRIISGEHTYDAQGQLIR